MVDVDVDPDVVVPEAYIGDNLRRCHACDMPHTPPKSRQYAISAENYVLCFARTSLVALVYRGGEVLLSVPDTRRRYKVGNLKQLFPIFCIDVAGGSNAMSRIF